MTVRLGIRSLIGQIFNGPKFYFLNMESLIREFTSTEADDDLELFEEVIASKLTPDIILKVERETRGQSEKQEWRNLKLGRITASNVFEISRCHTERGISNNIA